MRRIQQARALRKRQTDSERVLWFRLRDRRLRGLKFRRQVPVDRFIVDFLCAEAHLIVEIDGGQHAATDETLRTMILESMGYLVLRFWSNEVLSNIDGVLTTILDTLDPAAPPHPDPLPNGERESIPPRAKAMAFSNKKSYV